MSHSHVHAKLEGADIADDSMDCLQAMKQDRKDLYASKQIHHTVDHCKDILDDIVGGREGHNPSMTPEREPLQPCEEKDARRAVHEDVGRMREISDAIHKKGELEDLMMTDNRDTHKHAQER
jgi:hypothetical protein